MSANAIASRHPEAGADLVRIGELARRVDLSPHVLRAWERRYGIFAPVRSEGGFRLYSREDEARVGQMAAQIARGVAPAQAAAAIKAGAQAGEVGADPVTPLVAAMMRFDEAAVRQIIGRAVQTVGVDGTITTVIVPFLREVGAMWERGEATVAHEHFVSGALRARLMELTPRVVDEGGPHALLACPPDEFHDLPLVMTSVALRNRGWQVTMLGANTPVDAVAEAASRIDPQVVLVASPFAAVFDAVARELARVGRTHRLLLAGAGASSRIATRVSATYLPHDPVSATHQISVMALR